MALLLLDVQILLFHWRHFRRRQRSKTVARVYGSTFRMTFDRITTIFRTVDRIRFGTTLRRRIGCLNTAMEASICVAVARTARSLLSIHLCFCHCSGGRCRSSSSCCSLLTPDGNDSGHRSRSSPFHRFAPSRSVLVIWMLLQMDHTQSLCLLDIRSPVLWCQSFPLFTCKIIKNKKKIYLVAPIRQQEDR